MIVSHKHQFIFIKTRKTAGTSIEIALSRICGPKDIITPITGVDEDFRKKISDRSAQNYLIPFRFYRLVDWITFFKTFKRLRFYNHMAAKKIKEYVSREVWESYYKFAVDRNPFDKVISFFYWQKRGKENSDFQEFLFEGKLSKIMGYDQYSINGELAVDRIYKYEELASMCHDLSKKLNLVEPLKLTNYKAKSGLRKSENPESFWNKTAIQYIRKKFEREIELLQYDQV